MTRSYFTIILLISGLCFSSCKSRKHAEQGIRLNLERTACFGTCPIDELEIQSDGNATYNGKRFVEKEGQWKKTFSEDQVEELMAKFTEQDWSAFKDEYPASVSDLPSIILTVEISDVSKMIEIAGEHPEELDVYVSMLVELIDSPSWKKSTIR